MFPLLKLPCRINAIFPKPEISFFYGSFSLPRVLLAWMSTRLREGNIPIPGPSDRVGHIREQYSLHPTIHDRHKGE